MLQNYVKKILSSRVYDVAVETPLQLGRNLSRRAGCRVLLKREDLQPVFSFKIRGAYNKIAQLSEAERARGVITASAGNHAQGVALAAQELGLKATIVMGRNTPSIKVDAVRAFGARVVLHGDTYDDAAAHMAELAKRQGLVFIPPYDDLDVIAGQGTVGMEIMKQHAGAPDAIFVPVGGGGLIAGIAAYVKYLSPSTRIVGVEPEGSACLAAALEAGRRVTLPYEGLDLFADGVSVAQVGREPFKVARHCVDEVIVVNTDEICAAIKDLFEDTRSIAEPAGALAVAGLKKYVARGTSPEASLVAVVSGANVNFDRLRHIAERAEVGEQREAILAVTIPERPGSFRRFCAALGKRSVSEFNYRYADPARAHVYVGLQLGAPEDRATVVELLGAAGYAVEDMTANEAAKLHVRHMVGGRPAGDKPELLFRFEFPERPGALLNFLSGLGADWNITLFHYRNHGAAWGRVLVGFEGETSDRARLVADLRRIGYRFWEETGNPAYRLFLR
ncbi:MAG: threonine ammonia-lyase, biosynthetic [Gammaproteobacteria bacterium]